MEVAALTKSAEEQVAGVRTEVGRRLAMRLMRDARGARFLAQVAGIREGLEPRSCEMCSWVGRTRWANRALARV